MALGKVGREKQRQRSRSASDVQKSLRTVQLERGNQRMSDLARVCDLTDGVIARAPGVQRGVPRPSPLLLGAGLNR